MQVDLKSQTYLAMIMAIIHLNLEHSVYCNRGMNDYLAHQ